jgi:nitrogen fixation NifU-like protein
VDHYESPKNVGALDKNAPNVGTGKFLMSLGQSWHACPDFQDNAGLVGAPACGDVMKLQIKVSDDGVIQEAVFKVRSL